jgi:hypothetical protein
VRILLSAENFDAFGGTETYTHTVAQELMRLGHLVSIYTPNSGTMAELAAEKGIHTVGLTDLPSRCDVVLAQDAATCHELRTRYPEAVRVMTAHSRDHVLHETPQLAEVCHAVVVMNDRVGRWVRARPWHPPLTRMRQPIVLSRYSDLEPPRPRPRQVLVMSNYVTGPRGRLIEEACRLAGLETRWMGTTSEPSASPEQLLAKADVVIGLGRSVIEAMAAGRAVYVYGVLGGGGWVTPESYNEMEADGFAGLTDLRPTTVERLASDLAAWRPDMGEANRDLVSANHSARTHAVELVELLCRLRGGLPARKSSVSDRAFELTAGHQAPTATDEISRLLRLEWQTYTRGMHAIVEANRLRAEHEPREESLRDAVDRVAVLDRELEGARARLAVLEEHLGDARVRMTEQDAQLQALRVTRRYRLACLICAPLDALRTGIRARSR